MNTYYIFIVNLSHIYKFEVELGSSLRHCRNVSRKLTQLSKKDVEIKLNNQVRY